MGVLQESMRSFMEIRGYSERTISTYLTCVSVFAHHFGRSPLLISKKEIESFFHFLRQQHRSDSTIHLYYISLRFFYRINSIEDRVPNLRFRRIQNKIPVVLGRDRVVTILESCRSLKFKALFTLAYASGLRMSELRDLAVHDIDFGRRLVYVRNGKNGRSRYSILGIKTIQLLRVYINVYRPHSYLFYNRMDNSAKVSEEAIRRELRQLLDKNGIDAREVHLHTLRHCFATHLMENGTSIFHIMHLLGHTSICTTMIYLHMQNVDKLNIISPIDLAEARPALRVDSQNDLFAAIA